MRLPRIKKTKYSKKTFESTGVSSDTSANIYMSMLMSPAWKALTAKQQRLYLYCKAQYYAERRKPSENPLAFTMNQSKWCDLYELYKVSDKKSFYRDIAALVTYGFIICLANGWNTRTKTIYAFSDVWQLYGTDAFEVREADKTQYMRNEDKRTAKKDANKKA